MPQRLPSANRLTERVHAAVRASLPTGTTCVAVACSGGRDSVCVAHAVAVVLGPSGGTLTLCHVRHNVRGDDDRDLAVVRDLAEHLGAGFWYELLPAPAEGQQLSEGRLRDARYAALGRMARSAGADVLVTGHTMDDQAETVFLHLIRGSGLDGLAGMRESAPLPGHAAHARDGDVPILLIRPLLTVRREETAAYCVAHGLPYLDDPSNSDERYARNWMRHSVLPVLRTRNPDVTPTLARTARLIAVDADYLRAETERAFERCARTDDGTLQRLDRDAFLREPQALRVRMVRAIITEVTDSAARADTVIAAERRLTAASASRITIADGYVAAIIENTIVTGDPSAVDAWTLRSVARRYPLFRGSHALQFGEPTIFCEWSAQEGFEYAFMVGQAGHRADAPPGEIVQRSYLALPGDTRLSVRNRRPGDRFRPVPGTHSVRLQDFFTARRIPAVARDWLLLLTVNDTIAAVIGHACSAEFAAVPGAASHVMTLVRRPVR